MKKRIFALALALCMMLSVMPTSFAGHGILTLDNATNNNVTTGSEEPRLTLNPPSTVTSSGTNTTYNTYTAPNPYSVSYTGREGEGETPVVDAPYASEKLADTGSANTVTGIATTTESAGVSGTTAAAPANSTTIAITKDNPIERTKSITDNRDGTYTITIGAKTNSNKIKVKSAANIVLVLDASQSMAGDDATTLKSAVDTFLRGMIDSTGSKVAIVSYDDTATRQTGNDSNPASALIPITIEESPENEVDNLVLNPDLTKATQAVVTATNTTTNKGKKTDTGLELAVDILQDYQATYPDDETPCTVILFTNGVPTKDVTAKINWWDPNTWGNLWGQENDAYGIAQDSLHWSTILKGTGTRVLTDKEHRHQAFYDSWSKTDDTTWARMLSKNTGCGATVYCVGVGLPDYAYPRSNGAKINEFLYRASSHVPNSSHTDSGYLAGRYDDSTRNQEDGYYLVGNMSGLGDIFSQIEVEAGVSLDKLIVEDIVPAYMEIVSAEGATISADKTTATWSNVALSPTSPISKTLTVKFKDGFLGGNSVPTNNAASGLYSVDEKTGAEILVGAFGIPTMNVDAKAITPSVRNQNIYLSNDADLRLLIKELHGSIDGVNNKYVDVIYTIANEAGNVVCTYTVAAGKTAGYWSAGTTAALTADLTYTVSCRVDAGKKSDGAGNYIDTENKPTAKVVVFKPHITFKDSTIYLGNWAYYAANHDPNCVVWKAGDTEANNMIGAAPAVTVQYSHDQADSRFTTCQDIDVTHVLLGDDNQTNYVTATTFNADGHNGSAANTPEFTVHVVRPVAEFKDTCLRLGDEPTNDEFKIYNVVKEFSKDKITWKHIGNDEISDNWVGDPAKVTYEFSPESTEYTGCTTVDVTVYSGSLKSYDEEDAFTVHVLKPVVQFQDSTIYLGYEPTTNDFEAYNIVKNGDTHKITWIDANNHEIDDLTPYKNVNTTVKFKFPGAIDEDYTNCALISAKVLSGGKESHTGSFTVHVLKPSFSVQDGYIYQGQTKDLTKCIVLGEWKDKDTHERNTNIVGGEGAKPSRGDFAFEFDGGTDLSACSPITVGAASINNKDALSYFNGNVNFTVHVLKPTFAVNTNDLWADYGTSVDLYNADQTDTISKIDMTWAYTGGSCEKNKHVALDELDKLPDPPTAPTIKVTDVTFAEGAEHTMKAKDANFKVSGVKYTNSFIINQETGKLVEQTAGLDDVAVTYVKDTNGNDKDYVILHVNKFDLTISKTWLDGNATATETYKQDAIFNLYHVVGGAETGNLITQVVLPAGQENVKITGLLCGQTYKVEEQTNWTWRWTGEAAKTVAGAAHGVTASDPHADLTNNKHVEPVSFINRLFNRLWFSFCTFIENIFQKGGN